MFGHHLERMWFKILLFKILMVNFLSMKSVSKKTFIRFFNSRNICKGTNIVLFVYREDNYIKGYFKSR